MEDPFAIDGPDPGMPAQPPMTGGGAGGWNAPTGGGAGGAVAAPAAPQTEEAPAPPPQIRAILRGRIIAGSASGTYSYEGQWALSQDLDEPTSEFKYSFKLPAAAQPPMLPSGYVPRNPAIPSTPDDVRVSAPMSGFFNVKGAGGAVTKVKEDRVMMRFGGAVPAEAPLTITETGSHTTGEAPVAPGSLIGVTGEGQNQVGKFTLEGAYHPPTGNLWCLKAYVQTPIKKPDDRTSRASRGPTIPPALARNMTTEQRICKNLVSEVRRLGGRDADPFLEPVDPDAQGLKDYRTIVTHPMDLRTVELKIVNGEYATIDDFAADVHLTFDNAIRYNGPEHWAGKAARKMREIFDERFQDQKERRRRQEEETRIRAQQAEEAKRRAELERKEEAKRRDKERQEAAARRTSSGPVGTKREREDDGPAAGAPPAKKAKKDGPATPAGGMMAGFPAAMMPMMGNMMGDSDAAAIQMRAMFQMMGTMFAQAAMQNPDALTGMMGMPGMPAPALPAAAAAPAPAAAKPAASSSSKKKTSSAKPAAAAPAPAARVGTTTTASRTSSGPVSAMAPVSRSLTEVHGASIPLTEDEMVELSSSIEALNGDQMQRIAQILKEANYLAPDADMDEVEIDPSTIGTKTLREIKAYADACLGRGPAYRPSVAPQVPRPVAAAPPMAAYRPPTAPVAAPAAPGYGPLSGYPDDDDDDVAPPPF